jgi:hypothetical protein
VLLGLALTSQQFPWLILAPLFVVVPTGRRSRLAVGAVVAATVVDLPLILVTSGRALGPAVLGSGSSPSPVGGTVFWEFHLHGASLITVSRLLPILIAMVLAGWALRRLGPGVLRPVPLLSLLATALTLRLVFEVNLWGYYFFAATLMLIVLNVVRGRVQLSLVVWVVFVALAFDPVAWGSDVLAQEIPRWLWQLILVSSALALAADPLLAAIGDHTRFEQPPALPDGSSAACAPEGSVPA